MNQVLHNSSSIEAALSNEPTLDRPKDWPKAQISQIGQYFMFILESCMKSFRQFLVKN